MLKKPVTLVVAGTSFLGLLVSSLSAGPLNPPVGPVAPTHKTLTEVEPRIAINSTNTPSGGGAQYRITQPGSYYLTGNLDVANIQHGVQIDLNTDGLVTIDLNGFSIIGREGTLNGIDVDPPFSPRVVIRNGFVTSFEGNGIDMIGAESCTIENVECSRNSGRGFVVQTGSLKGCKAQFNSAGGFKVGAFSSLTECDAVNTGPIGIETDSDCRVVDCTVKGCSSQGFDCDSNCTLIRCVARSNGTHGFVVDFSQVSECLASGNTLDGFTLGGGTTISKCTAISNRGNGFYGAGGCVVIECSSLLNHKHGIWLSFEGNIIRGNHCSANGQGVAPGAGILTQNISNRIEDNVCNENDLGIDVDGTRSVIVRNSCSRNTTNWSIVAGNSYGPIIDRSVGGGGAVNGNAAAAALGSTDASANFTN